MAVDSFASAAPATFHPKASARSGAKHVSGVRRPDGCPVETRRRRVTSAPQKLVRATRPANQHGGLTSEEGPSSLAARRAGSLAAKAQQVASPIAAGPGRGPIKRTGSGWATRRMEACGVDAPETGSLSASSIALVLGLPQFGHELPGPGRRGSRQSISNRPPAFQPTSPFLRSFGGKGRQQAVG